MPLLAIQDLRVYFHTRRGVVRAVDGVSLRLEPGETLGIVGESGSGKTVLTSTLLGLTPIPPGRIESGHAVFGGRDLAGLTRREMRGLAGREIAMIFQDPMTALNPYMTVGRQVMEPLLVHRVCGKEAARERALAALEKVGIPEAESRMASWPHELSGGMRQRVVIAMALVTRPRLLIADEPTTALDATVQARILEMTRDLQENPPPGLEGMGMLFVTHDLAVVSHVAHRVLVMYAGRVMETAPTEALFAAPLHPYTQALLRSLPRMDDFERPIEAIPGEPPDLTQEMPGCPFAARCPLRVERCDRERPPLEDRAPGHACACWKA